MSSSLKSVTVIVLFALTLCSASSVLSQSGEDIESLKAKLEEAQAQLKADLANKEKTDAIRQEIEDKLSARQARESEILEEFETLCNEQEELKAGSFNDCMAGFNN